VVEEAGVPGENHGQATGKLYHLRLRVECTLFVIYDQNKFILSGLKSYILLWVCLVVKDVRKTERRDVRTQFDIYFLLLSIQY
jgi:hypothetical protein